MKKLKVLSLFDGISCGQIALQRANIEYDNYYSSEIDPYAISISKYNFPNTIQLGDVKNCKNWNIDWSSIDLLIGGSPCTQLSTSGTREGLYGKDSSLYFYYRDILNFLKQQNPNIKFLLENVRMEKKWEDIITQDMGVQCVLINSNLVSAQNRPRLYWSNIDNISQPEDKHIYLNDILEKQVDNKYYLNNSQLSKIEYDTINKEYTTDVHIIGHRKNYRRNLQIFLSDGKTETIDSSQGDGRQAHVLVVPEGPEGYDITNINPATIVGRRINQNGVRSDNDKTIPITQCLQVKHSNGKSGCLTTVQKDNVVTNILPGRYVDFYGTIIEDPLFVRRLTPLEYERLQTIPDNFSKYGMKENKIVEISDSQRYKCIGNGWTVDVISHILKGLKR